MCSLQNNAPKQFRVIGNIAHLATPAPLVSYFDTVHEIQSANYLQPLFGNIVLILQAGSRHLQMKVMLTKWRIIDTVVVSIAAKGRRRLPSR
jgi:hypothetical protein